MERLVKSLQNVKVGSARPRSGHSADPPPRPNKHTGREGWNAHFEDELALKYNSYKSPPMETQKEHDWIWQTQDIADENVGIAQRTKELMRDEGILIANALENLVYGTFEADWKALGVERKRELILEGLYRGSCTSPRENSRVICPALTIEGLIGDGEYSLINLLKRIIAHDPTGNRRVRELFLFSHPYPEHEYRHTDAAPDRLKAFLYNAILLRNCCIVETLNCTLEAYNNYPAAPAIPMKYANRRRDETREARKEQSRAEIKKQNLRRIVDGSQCKERKPLVSPGCSTCSTKTSLEGLKRCGRCQLVWYCSSECQKKAWPDHKKFCGKGHFDPELLAPTPQAAAEFISCPVAAEGYIRTPALWRQIWYLSKADSQRSFYHFDTKPGHSDSILIEYPPGARDVFLVARRRAMASGSLPAIHMMYTIVLDGTLNGYYPLTPEQIRRQFEREYRVAITPATMRAAAPFAPPAAQELMEEREYLQMRLESVDLFFSVIVGSGEGFGSLP
ncbi:hypothetical protein DFH06DRAFT_1347524 [Mycena polygramma]|nr:hypothetical protein DFH06DRAFT_1347524 [Mycena polygramma]